jgi:protein-disulfide isomerase
MLSATKPPHVPLAVANTSPTIDARDIKIDGRPIRGAEDAKVTIVFFDDFQCPYSAAMYGTLFDGVLKDYATRVKVALRDMPNAQIHPWAMHSAIDANCLAAQSGDAYWDFTDYVHAHQTETTADRLDKLALEQGQKYHLRVAPLQECIQAQSDAAIRPLHSEAFQQLGVKAVPMLFINGERLRGERSAQQLREAIDRALRAVGESVPTQAAPMPGTKAATPGGQPGPGTAGPVQAPKQADSELIRPTEN